MNFLTDEERSQLKLQHKQERDKRVCDRIKAVLLYDKGWSYEQIAEVLLLTGAAISNPIEDYTEVNSKVRNRFLSLLRYNISKLV